jgi:hypothetical protein
MPVVGKGGSVPGEKKEARQEQRPLSCRMVRHCPRTREVSWWDLLIGPDESSLERPMILSVVLAVSRHEGQQPHKDEVVSSSLFELPGAR